jgi:hypothetical protein
VRPCKWRPRCAIPPPPRSPPRAAARTSSPCAPLVHVRTRMTDCARPADPPRVRYDGRPA